MANCSILCKSEVKLSASCILHGTVWNILEYFGDSQLKTGSNLKSDFNLQQTIGCTLRKTHQVMNSIIGVTACILGRSGRVEGLVVIHL